MNGVPGTVCASCMQNFFWDSLLIHFHSYTTEQFWKHFKDISFPKLRHLYISFSVLDFPYYPPDELITNIMLAIAVCESVKIISI